MLKRRFKLLGFAALTANLLFQISFAMIRLIGADERKSRFFADEPIFLTPNDCSAATIVPIRHQGTDPGQE